MTVPPQRLAAVVDRPDSGHGDRIRLQRHEQEKLRDPMLPRGERATNVNASLDGSRPVAITTSDLHGDIWLARSAAARP